MQRKTRGWTDLGHQCIFAAWQGRGQPPRLRRRFPSSSTSGCAAIGLVDTIFTGVAAGQHQRDRPGGSGHGNVHR